MDKGQILADYRLAKNHRRQINILADLNACDPLTIIDILKAVTERKKQAATSVDEKEKASLRVQLEEYKTANEELMKRVKELESQIVEMKRTGKTDSDLFDKYQQLCIQNNKLSTTVDVLVDKISMLKAVGCHG